ncbi:MAG: anti-sigma factor [Solirubrobacterales bacterium]|nr:anti-sigma factor [Solirubrobacterales bacterium]
MNDEARTPSGESCGADVAAYALGALDPAETTAFERHLEGCAICAEELTGYGDVVDRLAMTVPQHPVAPRLRRRVLADVRSESQKGRPFRLLNLLAGSAPRGWFVRTSMATALGLVAVAIAIATLVSSGAGGARLIQARVVDSPGSAQVRLVDDRAELIVRHFPQPAAGDIYEVWLQRPTGRPEPTRVLFSVTAHGAGDIGVPGGLHGVKAILVTEEPAGGTLVPTHPPVIVGPLS